MPMRLSVEERKREIGRRQVGRWAEAAKAAAAATAASLTVRALAAWPGDDGGNGSGGAAAAAQCFALGIFDCRITNETPTFAAVVAGSALLKE